MAQLNSHPIYKLNAKEDCQKGKAGSQGQSHNEDAAAACPYLYAFMQFQSRDRERATDPVVDRHFRTAPVHHIDDVRNQSGPGVSSGPSRPIPEWVTFFNFFAAELYRVYEFIRRVLY